LRSGTFEQRLRRDHRLASPLIFPKALEPILRQLSPRGVLDVSVSQKTSKVSSGAGGLRNVIATHADEQKAGCESIRMVSADFGRCLYISIKTGTPTVVSMGV
jgi:hypothetical protein